ncbi:isoprenylcysteine alpha-carbonyl methylesterase ICMEL2 [Fusarium pseudocircinatum]|uniref:Isoprenylcysteine alpha-carbonyl methylesterase ICMEL2 n=1 Tax=Fusarium pseudocircinatum TaxID=56676 RepID=A0A8H5UXY7_9HYPO|nr:isoprenylcysteine alpha-carbonyl methylesterase ICMEL2 [Fusarium pseudocircinatum]
MAVKQKSPRGLLKACKRENKINEVAFGAEVLVLTASPDPEAEVLSPNEDFVTYWRSNRVDSASSLSVQTMDGHNHISPTSSLGTGDSAEEVCRF